MVRRLKLNEVPELGQRSSKACRVGFLDLPIEAAGSGRGFEPWACDYAASSQSLAALHGPLAGTCIAREQQDVALPLIIPLGMPGSATTASWSLLPCEVTVASYAGSLSVLAHLMHFPCRKFWFVHSA